MSTRSVYWFCSRRFACSLFFVAFGIAPTAVLLPPSALADLGEYCREIELTGAAGFGSQDEVVFKVVDATNPLAVPITQSCTLTVQANETAVDFLRRIPGSWGNGDGGDGGTNVTCKRFCTEPEILPGDGGTLGIECLNDTQCDVNGGDGVCGERPKKVCGNAAVVGPSCTIEARITQQKGKCSGGVNNGKGCLSGTDCPGGTCPVLTGDGSLRSCEDAAVGETCLKKPALLRACCREGAFCKGSKLDEIAPNLSPISIQTKVQPVPVPTSAINCLQPSIYCPTQEELPDDSVEPRTIAIDPIGGRSGPYRRQRECRVALQEATGAVTQATYDALRSCHRRVMAGELPSGSCATVTPTSDPGGLVAAAAAALQSAVEDDCAASGLSPSTLGYRSCPAPCDAIPVGTCSAGMVGDPCQRDRHCDTAPAALDGICGAWSALTNCTLCQAAAAGVQAVNRSFGNSGPGAGLPAAVKQCQNTLGDGISMMLAGDLRDVAKCQRNVDQFKVILSERTPKCKDADVKRQRAKVRAAAAALVTAACNNAALAQLDSCASNLAGLGVCAPRIAARATAAVIDAAAPEGRCGDSKISFGEKCDDGNVVDGDGCDSNCTPTGCGNAVISTGEECDDGNVIAADGCDPLCHSEPQSCAPQMCSTYTFDCSTLFPGDCGCFQAAEGGGLCVNNFDCNSAQPCSSSVDCTTPGERCYLQSCCGGPLPGRCGPPTCTGQPE